MKKEAATLPTASALLRFWDAAFLFGFGLVELRPLPFPFGGGFRLPLVFRELFQSLKAFFYAVSVVASNLVIALFHAFVAGNEQQLSFTQPVLSQQTATEDAPGAEHEPVVWKFVFANGQALAGEWFRVGIFALSQETSGETIKRLRDGLIIRGKDLSPDRERLSLKRFGLHRLATSVKKIAEVVEEYD
jgi:hypothetical protein